MENTIDYSLTKIKSLQTERDNLNCFQFSRKSDIEKEIKFWEENIRANLCTSSVTKSEIKRDRMTLWGHRSD